MAAASAAASLCRSTKIARYQRPRRRADRCPTRRRIAGPNATGGPDGRAADRSQLDPYDVAEAQQREKPLEQVDDALSRAHREPREPTVALLHLGEAREIGHDLPAGEPGPLAQRGERLVRKYGQVIVMCRLAPGEAEQHVVQRRRVRSGEKQR